MAIKNPEKECKEAPRKFSTESKALSFETHDYFGGIVLDSPEEFAQALIIYGGGEVKGSRATQDNLFNETEKNGGAMGVGMLLLGGIKNSEGFLEKLTKEALSELKKKKTFCRDFDYDAIGTNFFKTHIKGRKIEDKYLLELGAAYVGSQPEDNLREKMHKPNALFSSEASFKLSIVDGWWVNLNLEKLLSDFPISKQQVESMINHETSIHAPDMELNFNYKGQNLSLYLGLNINRSLRPEGGKEGSEYIQRRGKKIVGGTWTTYYESEDEVKIIPKAKNPHFYFSVSMPGGSQFRSYPSVTEKQKNLVISARDYLAGLIKLSKK